MSANEETRRLVDQAAQLVNTLGDQASRDEANYRRGYEDATRLYRVMFDHGVDVGRKTAEDAEEKKWADYIQPALRAASKRGTVFEYRRCLRRNCPVDLYARKPQVT